MTGAGLPAIGAGEGFAGAGVDAGAGVALAASAAGGGAGVDAGGGETGATAAFPAGTGVVGAGGAIGTAALAAGAGASATAGALAGDAGAVAAGDGAGTGGVTAANGAEVGVAGVFAVNGVTGALPDSETGAAGGALALASSAGLVGRKIRGRQKALEGTSGTLAAAAALGRPAGTVAAVPVALCAGVSFFSDGGVAAAANGLLAVPSAAGAMAIRPPTGSTDAAFAGDDSLGSAASAGAVLATIRSAPGFVATAARRFADGAVLATIRSAPGDGFPAAPAGLAAAGAPASILPEIPDTRGLLVEAGEPGEVGSALAALSGAGATFAAGTTGADGVPVLVFDSAAAVITAAKAGKTTGLMADSLSGGLMADSFSGGLPLTKLPVLGPAVRGTSLPKPAWPAFPAAGDAAAGSAISGSG
jgi:hypothetical protein